MTSSLEMTANFIPHETIKYPVVFYMRDNIPWVKKQLGNDLSGQQVIDRAANEQDSVAHQPEWSKFIAENPNALLQSSVAVHLTPFQAYQKEQAEISAARAKQNALREEILRNRNQGAVLNVLAQEKIKADALAQIAKNNQEPLKNGIVAPSAYDPQMMQINARAPERAPPKDKDIKLSQ